MSTLFLIGNGFDINCGMKTRYIDVYEGYIKEGSATENIKEFKREIDANIEDWGDFEMAMAKYAGRLYSETNFLECVRDFALYMEKHLLKEVEDFRTNISNQIVRKSVFDEVQRSMGAFCSGISHNVDAIMNERGARIIGNMNAISFNYTDVFDTLFAEYVEYFSMDGRSSEVVHVHGLLGDDPVFGVDNAEQLKTIYNLSRKGRRGFIKPVFNEEYDWQRAERARIMIHNADTICVYGMSLGESDLSWRNEIIEWLRADRNHHLFIYRYSLSRALYRTVTEKMDLEDDEKEKLLTEWGISDESSILEQIHIPCGKNIFNIQEVIENIQRENNAKRIQDLKEKIEQGKENVEQHLQDVVVV